MSPASSIFTLAVPSSNPTICGMANGADPLEILMCKTVPSGTFSPVSYSEEITRPDSMYSSSTSSNTGSPNPASLHFSITASRVSPLMNGIVAIPSTGAATPLPELIVRRITPFTSIKEPPTGRCIIMFPAGIYSEPTLPLTTASSFAFSIITIASSFAIPSTSGAMTILSGMTTSLEYLEKLITPVRSNAPNTTNSARTVGTVTLSQSGQEKTSIFRILPYRRLAGGSAYNSSRRVETSGVRSSIRTFKPFKIAISRLTETFFVSLCGSTRMSLFWFSYFARRSMASGGVFPVIIL